jgi:hypothetical protein
MESLMLPLYMKLTRNADKPNLIVMSDDYFSFYEQSQTSIKRYVSNDSADGGFMELAYKGTPVIFDGSSGMAASHAYFLNTNYLELVVHEEANLTPLDSEVRPYNQDAVNAGHHLDGQPGLVESLPPGRHEGLRRTTCVSLLSTQAIGTLLDFSGPNDGVSGEPVHRRAMLEAAPTDGIDTGTNVPNWGQCELLYVRSNSSSTFTLGRLVTIDKDFNIADLANTANLGRPVAVVLTATSRRAT